MNGGKAPPAYLHSLQNHKQVQASNPNMDAILCSHHIDLASLRADDCAKFFELHNRSLLSIIEQALGNTIRQIEGIKPDIDAETDDSDDDLKAA